MHWASHILSFGFLFLRYQWAAAQEGGYTGSSSSAGVSSTSSAGGYSTSLPVPSSTLSGGGSLPQYCSGFMPSNTSMVPFRNESTVCPCASNSSSKFLLFDHPCYRMSNSDARRFCAQFPGGTLANVTSADFSQIVSELNKSAGPLYINAWNGDNYQGACIALFPGGAIAVPREGCAGPLSFICQVPMMTNIGCSNNSMSSPLANASMSCPGSCACEAGCSASLYNISSSGNMTYSDKDVYCNMTAASGGCYKMQCCHCKASNESAVASCPPATMTSTSSATAVAGGGQTSSPATCATCTTTVVVVGGGGGGAGTGSSVSSTGGYGGSTSAQSTPTSSPATSMPSSSYCDSTAACVSSSPAATSKPMTSSPSYSSPSVPAYGPPPTASPSPAVVSSVQKTY